MSTGANIKQWGPGLLLAVLAIAGWMAAIAADTDTVSTTRVDYSSDVQTPVLSARRMPRAVQAPFADSELEPRIQEAIAQTPGDPCVLVRSGNRNIGPQHNIDVPVVPASNQKIITTFVALERLGPNFRFRTTVESDGQVVDGKLTGNLYLVGGGDPFLTTDDWWTQYSTTEGRSATRLEDLADAVVELGITEIEGAIIGDESQFDQERAGPWAQRLIDSNQSGPLSALTVNEGFVDWPETFPGSSAQRSPTNEPALHSASVFSQLLAERGITIGNVSIGAAPADAVVRAAVESPPLSETITHINSFSSNIGAELLLKQIGVQSSGLGTTQEGIKAVEATLAEFVEATDGDLVIRDGSGLSEENRLTCSVLASVLDAVGPGSAVVDSLSISGERGSLSTTYVGTPAEGTVRAKTGTLNGVTSLAGYVMPEGNGGESIMFVFVANGPAVVADPAATNAARDALVLAVADYPEGPALAELSPRPAAG